MLSTANAVDLWPVATIGAVTSGNATRSNTDAQSDIVGVAQAAFTYLNDSPFLEADVDGQASRLQFFHHTLPSDNLFQLRADALAHIVPENFSWALQENYGQIAVEPFSALSPVGYENINYLTTGPNVNLPFGARDRLSIQARYSVVTIANSDVDNKRVAGELQYQHDISPRQRLTVQLYQSHLNFQADKYPDYNLRNGSATFASEGARSSFEGTIGESEVYNSAATNRNVLLALRLNHRLTPHLSLEFDAHDGISDTADSFRLDQVSSGPTIFYQNVSNTTEPFKLAQGNLKLVFQGPRHKLYLGVSAQRDRYINAAVLDRDLYGVMTGWTYLISPAFSFYVSGSYSTSKQRLAGTGLRDSAATAGFDYRLTRSVRITATADHYDRSADIAALGFKENRFTLFVVYAPRGTPLRIDDRGLTKRPGVGGMRSPTGVPVPGATPN